MQKFLQAIKIWFMVFWRASLLLHLLGFDNNLIPFWLGVIIAFIFVYTMNTGWRFFPLIRLARGQKDFTYFIGESSHSKNSATSTKDSKKPSLPRQQKTQRLGSMTGFEPKNMDKIPVPRGNRMFGVPGGGLHNASFGQKQIDIGVQGEQLFAKILQRNGILEKYDSYWSISMPDAHSVKPDMRFNTDIDCILVGRKEILLIDVKMYTGGDGMYENRSGAVVLIDNQTHAQVGSVHKPTKNMLMALDRFAQLFPRYTVRAMVVFVPTNRGMANMPKNGLPWIGNIRAYNIQQALTHIGNLKSSPKVDTLIQNNLTKLLRK